MSPGGHPGPASRGQAQGHPEPPTASSQEAAARPPTLGPGRAGRAGPLSPAPGHSLPPTQDPGPSSCPSCPSWCGLNLATLGPGDPPWPRPSTWCPCPKLWDPVATLTRLLPSARDAERPQRQAPPRPGRGPQGTPHARWGDWSLLCPLCKPQSPWPCASCVRPRARPPDQE